MNKRKRFVIIFLLGIFILIGAFVTYVSTHYQDLTTPPCVELPLDAPQTPVAITPYEGELVFLTDQDKKDIYAAIDAARDAKDFDNRFFAALTRVFDRYNSTRPTGTDMLLAPEIMSDNPGKIEITSNGCKTDLLAGIDLSSIKKDDMPQLKAFAKLFVEETSKYPLSWWEKAVPPFVVFVKAVKVNGEIVAGIEHGAVVYNISEISNMDWSRRVIHHELMHWLELASRTRTDPDWPGMKTSYMGTYDLTSKVNFSEHPELGFITGYAKTNSLEDKAEIYSYLFTDPNSTKITRLAKSDALLNKKLEYIKKFIQRRVTKMDNTYFQKYVLNP